MQKRGKTHFDPHQIVLGDYVKQKKQKIKNFYRRRQAKAHPRATSPAGKQLPQYLAHIQVTDLKKAAEALAIGDDDDDYESSELSHDQHQLD